MDAPVDPAALYQALESVVPNYPNLNAKIVAGFFWHKYKQNDAPLVVKEDDRPPLTPFRKEDANGYPFRLAYKGDEIILEVFHAATDGDVAALFLSDLLTRYVEIKEKVSVSQVVDRGLLLEDAFVQNARKKSLFDVSIRNYNGTGSIALGKRGNYRPYPTLLSQKIPVAELKASAKSWGATITEYIAACYVTAISQDLELPLRKPINLFVPVNLRRFFPSKTLFNFVCFERITLSKGETDLSFAHVLELVHKQFEEKITQENMQRRVDDVNLCFTLPIVKYFPLFIKKPCFKIVKKITDKVRQTAILSNLGSINLPESTAAHVAEIQLYLNIGKNAPLNCAVISFKGDCTINMTCGLKETEIPARFFALLKDQGKK